MNYNSLPSLVGLAILVVVFRSMSRRDTSERLRLWLIAWNLGFSARFRAVHGRSHGSMAPSDPRP
jgi:hypothetical protein